jgi:hypothetical protein
MHARRFLLVSIFVGALGATTGLPVYAQNTAKAPDRPAPRVETDRGFDWGLLGLLGLAGLLGLKRDKRDDYTTRPTSR